VYNWSLPFATYYDEQGRKAGQYKLVSRRSMFTILSRGWTYLALE